MIRVSQFTLTTANTGRTEIVFNTWTLFGQQDFIVSHDIFTINFFFLLASTSFPIVEYGQNNVYIGFSLLLALTRHLVVGSNKIRFIYHTDEMLATTYKD